MLTVKMTLIYRQQPLAPHKPYLLGEKKEGMTILCLMPKIPQILRGEKAEHHYCLREESTNTTYERLERIIQRNLWLFILKTLQNSRMKVDRRAWDIVLNLIILLFNCSRPKWRLQAPWLKVIWVSWKLKWFILTRGEFLFEHLCTCEAWKHGSNSWSTILS
jgi:hypothetical protein